MTSVVKLRKLPPHPSRTFYTFPRSFRLVPLEVRTSMECTHFPLPPSQGLPVHGYYFRTGWISSRDLVFETETSSGRDPSLPVRGYEDGTVSKRPPTGRGWNVPTVEWPQVRHFPVKKTSHDSGVRHVIVYLISMTEVLSDHNLILFFFLVLYLIPRFLFICLFTEVAVIYS